MRSPEDVAREALGNIAGPMCHIWGSGRMYHELLDSLDVLVAQEAEVPTDLIRARDAEVAEAAKAETRYVVSSADWCEPPGGVIAVFATKAEAWAHIRGPGDGYGWSIVEVPAPAVEP